MSASLLGGQRDWSMVKDEDGHRTYTIVYRVKVAKADGPSVALTASGLPTIGNTWIVDNENDPWAWCTPGVKITPVVTGEPNTFFDLEYVFTTKPLKQDPTNFSTSPGSGGGVGSMPSGSGVENPLLIPDRISGSFTKFTEEATTNFRGDPVVNSAFEQLRGAPVEFDKNRLTVRIEQNRTDLQLPLILSMMDTVNDRTLWGMAARTIKLSSAPWERKFFGAGTKYYTRTLEFEVNADSYDRTILDEGTKVLNGHWDYTNRWRLDNVGILAPPRAPTVTFREQNASPVALLPAVYSYYIVVSDTSGDTQEGARTSVDLNAVLPQKGHNVISWDAVTGASFYTVYRIKKTAAGGEEETRIAFLVAADPGSTSFTDSEAVIGDPVGGVGGLPRPTSNTTGHAPDPFNPADFRRYKDRHGENARVLLNGFGVPVSLEATGTATATPGYVFLRKYKESNFALLSGLPTTF